MEAKKYNEVIKAIRARISRDIGQSIRVLQCIHKHLFEKLRKIDELDVDPAGKLSGLDKVIKGFDRMISKIFQLQSKKEATQPKWKFQDFGIYMLNDLGFSLPDSDSKEISVYKSTKNPSLLIVCNFKSVSECDLASKE